MPSWHSVTLCSLFLVHFHVKTPSSWIIVFPQVQTLIRNDAMEYDPSAHEEEPPDLEAGISIRNLTKIYNQVSS